RACDRAVLAQLQHVAAEHVDPAQPAPAGRPHGALPVERDRACDLFGLHRTMTLYVARMPKPTIALVHGAWADASSWNAVASHLQDQGFTVLAPPNLLRVVQVDAPYITS